MSQPSWSQLFADCYDATELHKIEQLKALHQSVYEKLARDFSNETIFQEIIQLISQEKYSIKKFIQLDDIKCPESQVYLLQTYIQRHPVDFGRDEAFKISNIQIDFGPPLKGFSIDVTWYPKMIKNSQVAQTQQQQRDEELKKKFDALIVEKYQTQSKLDKISQQLTDMEQNFGPKLQRMEQNIEKNAQHLTDIGIGIAVVQDQNQVIMTSK